jgi:hypothetical protein
MHSVRNRAQGVNATVRRGTPPWVVDGLAAGLVAWPCSEAPSAAHAAWRGASWRRTDEAAGTLLLPHEEVPDVRRRVGTALRVAVALNWGVVLSRWLDRRHPVLHGAATGGALFAFEYGLLGRRRPAVRALPALPQLADQVVFGAVAGAVLSSRRRARSGAGGRWRRPGGRRPR